MEDPVWPSAIVQVPPEFDRVIARALAKEAEQRYQTRAQFRRRAQAHPRRQAARGSRRSARQAARHAGRPRRGGEGSEAEKEFWKEVKDSDDPEDLKLYIEQFPRGEFVEEAKRRIAALGGGADEAAAPPPKCKQAEVAAGLFGKMQLH